MSMRNCTKSSISSPAELLPLSKEKGHKMRIQQWDRYGFRTTARQDQTLLAQKDQERNDKPIRRENN